MYSLLKILHQKMPKMFHAISYIFAITLSYLLYNRWVHRTRILPKYIILYYTTESKNLLLKRMF